MLISPPPRILTRGGFAFFAILFVAFFALFLSFGGVAIADEWDFLNTFFSDNYQVKANKTGANINDTSNNAEGRFSDGLLGPLNYSITNMKKDWEVQVRSTGSLLLGATREYSLVRVSPDFDFGTNLGTSTPSEEGGRLYEIDLKVKINNNSQSTNEWGAISFGYSNTPENYFVLANNGIGINYRHDGRYAIHDNNVTVKEGSFTYGADGYANIKIQYTVPDFNGGTSSINIYFNDDENPVTTINKQLSGNRILFENCVNANTTVTPTANANEYHFSDLVIKSSANYNYNVSNADVFALDKNWTTNGLDKRDVLFQSARDGETEAEHTGSITMGANTIVDVASGLTLLQSGDITGQYTLTKTGEGTLELTAANTYDGGTTISDGTLKLSGAGTLGTGAVTVGENATLEIAYDNPNTSVNISSISMADGDVFNEGSAFKVPSGAVTFGTENVALNNLSGGSLGANGQIAVPATLTVTGKLTLNNDQLTKFIGSITAPTVEKTGLDTLQLCFDAQNAVSIGSLVVSSGRVDLKGYMQGGITVDANGVFSPGNSVGEAKFGGGYELYDGAKLLIEMDETGVDSLIASSFIENGGIIELVIDGIPSGAQYDVITATNGFSGSQDEAYWLGKFGTLPDYLTLSVVDGVYGANSQTVRLSIDRNAVPEPSTWALLLLGAAGLLYVRKQTRK